MAMVRVSVSRWRDFWIFSSQAGSPSAYAEQCERVDRFGASGCELTGTSEPVWLTGYPGIAIFHQLAKLRLARGIHLVRPMPQAVKAYTTSPKTTFRTVTAAQKIAGRTRYRPQMIEAMVSSLGNESYITCSGITRM